MKAFKGFRIDVATIKLIAGLAVAVIVALLNGRVAGLDRQALTDALVLIIAALVGSDLTGLAVRNNEENE